MYCKFSHKRSDDGKAIELLENQIENFKKEIEIKDTEIQRVSKEIMNLERKMDSKISISKQNYEEMEKEIREIKVENMDIKSKYLALQKEVEGIRTMLSGKGEAVDTELEKIPKLQSKKVIYQYLVESVILSQIPKLA